MDGARRAFDVVRGYVNREWDRLQGADPEIAAEMELNAGPELATPKPAVTITPMDEATARRILGVSETAPFNEMKRAYEQLEKRSDPGNFPAGSEEARKAASIRTRVRAAYQLLIEHSDPTERRFGTLEID